MEDKDHCDGCGCDNKHHTHDCDNDNPNPEEIIQQQQKIFNLMDMLQSSVADATSEKEMAEIVEKVISNNKETGGKFPCLSALQHDKESNDTPPWNVPAYCESRRNPMHNTRFHNIITKSEHTIMISFRMIGKYYKTDGISIYYDDSKNSNIIPSPITESIYSLPIIDPGIIPYVAAKSGETIMIPPPNFTANKKDDDII